MKPVSAYLTEAGLPDDPALDLRSIVSPERVVTRLMEARPAIRLDPKDLKIRYIRYSRGENCVVAYEHPTRSGRSLPWLAYSKMYLSDVYGRMRNRALKNSSARGTGSVHTWDDLNTLCHIFPGDLKLAVDHFVNSAAPPILDAGSNGSGPSSHWLEGSEIIRWKPESRCLLKVPVRRNGPGLDESPDFVCIRFNRSDRMPDRDALMSLESPGYSKNVAVPVTLFRDDTTGVRIHPWLDATTLMDLLQNSEAVKWSELAGRVLAAWHSRPITSLPVRSVDRAMSRARLILDELKFHEIGEGADCGELLRDISALNKSCGPQDMSVLHGDFHPGQLMVSPHTVWILDTDGMCVGEAAVDLGNFAAQIMFHESREHISRGREILTAFNAGYSSSRGAQVPVERIAFWCALGLLDLAMKQIRRLRPGWRERSTTMMNIARKVVADQVLQT